MGNDMSSYPPSRKFYLFYTTVKCSCCNQWSRKGGGGAEGPVAPPIFTEGGLASPGVAM